MTTDTKLSVPTFEVQEAVRKPFTVDAVRVTAENMADVAKWCDGEIHKLGEHDGRYGPYIQVRVNRPLFPRQSQAFVGDWVLYTPSGGYKVYTDKAYHQSFETVRKGNSQPLELPAPGGRTWILKG